MKHKAVVVVTVLGLFSSVGFGWSESFNGSYDQTWSFQALNGGSYNRNVSQNYLRISSDDLPDPLGAGADVVYGLVGNKSYTDVVVGGWLNMSATDGDNTLGLLARANINQMESYAIGFSRGWGHFRLIKTFYNPINPAQGFVNLGTDNDKIDVSPNWDSKYYVELAIKQNNLTMSVYDQNMTFINSKSVVDDSYSYGNSGIIALVNPTINPAHNPGGTIPTPGGPMPIPTPIDSTFDDVFSTGLPGDANGDGVVNVSDLGILATNYGKTGHLPWKYGDFSGDGLVNVSDLGILATNYGTSGGTVPTPEPLSLALLAIGGLGLASRRNRS